MKSRPYLTKRVERERIRGMIQLERLSNNNNKGLPSPDFSVSVIKKSIAPLLEEGERVLVYFYPIKGNENFDMVPLNERLEELEETGNYLSVRTINDTAVNGYGEKPKGCAAIIVIDDPTKL